MIGSPSIFDFSGFVGAAYVFDRSGSTWSETERLEASDGSDSDWLGHSVAVDGDTVVAGAVDSAYVFTRSGSTWSEQAVLVPSGTTDSDRPGVAVAVSGDVAVIGVYTEPPIIFTSIPRIASPADLAGSVYVFVRVGSTWTEQARLQASDRSDYDLFGRSVAVDADTVIVGAEEAAYVFEQVGSGWSETAKLVASDGAANDFFGSAVALSADTAVIGAFGDDDLGLQSGGAYVFNRAGSTWGEQAKLLASDGADVRHFGTAVAASGDTVVVGANEDSETATAYSTYVFERVGAAWTEQGQLVASDATKGDRFGRAVAVSGSSAIVGAPGDFDLGNNSGSAYVFGTNAPRGVRFDYPFGSGDCSTFPLDDYSVEQGADFLDPAYDGDAALEHPGEDWNRDPGDADLGDPVCAVGTGVVVSAGNYFTPDNQWGNVVVVRHTLADGSRRWSQYAHLDTIAAAVVPGATVTRGDLIGTIGQGCNADRTVCPFSAHLHFEIRTADVAPDNWPDDEALIRAQYVDPTDQEWDWSGSGPGFIELHRFADILGSVFAGDIGWLLQQEITFGCDTAGEFFCPSDPVTRAQMASLLARAFGLEPVFDDRFDDVSGTHAGNINAIARAGITFGCNPDGNLYCPNDTVSRAQMASFLARALGLDPAPGDRFDDVTGVHEGNINAIASAGITLGCNPVGNLYCPNRPVTRGQMAALIHRAFS